MATIVVQDDKILRFLQVILDPDVASERVDAFRDYLAFDVPDPDAWFEEQRQAASAVYPSRIVMVGDEDAMRVALPDADAVVSEFPRLCRRPRRRPRFEACTEIWCRRAQYELGRLPESRRSSADPASPRKRYGGGTRDPSDAGGWPQAHRNHGALDFASLQALGYQPAKFDPDHVAGANWARIHGFAQPAGGDAGCAWPGRGRPRGCDAGRRYGYGNPVLPAHATAGGYRSGVFGDLRVLRRTSGRSDFVSVHLPLNAVTEGMLNADAFARMKPGAIVANISRAHIIDRDALIAALDSGHLGGAGLDVHYEEPGSSDEPLKSYSNVVLSPHSCRATAT